MGSNQNLCNKEIHLGNSFHFSDIRESMNAIGLIQSTVNSEIFARTLFSRNSAYAKFHENKTLAKWQNHSVVY